MKNYIESFKQQLGELKESGYKKQLSKYGESVARDIVSKSIINLISDIEITDQEIEFSVNELSSIRPVEKIKPVYIKLSDDLGVVNEVIYKEKPNLDSIAKATNRASLDVNNHFMNYVLSDNIKIVQIEKESLVHLLEKQEFTRILIVGNGTLNNLEELNYTIDSTDLKYAGNTKGGDLVYHCKHIPPKVIYAICLKEDKKLIKYLVKSPLTISVNQFIHKAGLKIKNPELIVKYAIV